MWHKCYIYSGLVIVSSYILYNVVSRSSLFTQSEFIQSSNKILKMTSTSTTFLYFAYGSNLFSERIREKNKTANKKAVGLLEGHQLEFAHWSTRWGGAVANILQEPKGQVHGVLWELHINDLASLDRQEGVGIGIYERIKIQVQSENKMIDCWTYKLTTATRDKSIATYGKEKLKPSPAYKEVIVRGAKEHQLPSDYVEKLEKIEHNGD